MDDSNKFSKQEQYMLGHDFRGSARLHLQHWMWLYRLGYLLHPSIPKRDDMRIIDIGTGNACWLIEMAKKSPSKWQFQGVDISKLQFPADEYLPKNISLETMNVFGDIPDDFVEKFDVVHIRTFAVAVTHSNPIPLVKNLVRMLKPGGYLQWDEFDPATFSARAPNESTGKGNCEELLQVFRQFAQKREFYFSWISDLSSTFKSNNLKNVEYYRLPPINDLRKASTDNILMGMEEIGVGLSTMVLGSYEKFCKLLKRSVLEAQQGVSLGMDMVVAVGQKPGPGTVLREEKSSCSIS